MTSTVDLSEQIRARGYWRVIVRPETFDAQRLVFEQLDGVIDRIRVTRRGWSVPHLNTREAPYRDLDFIGQDTAFGHHREVWRLYTSAQFVHLNGIKDDWYDQSAMVEPGSQWRAGGQIGVGEILFTLREYYEVVARYAQAVTGSDSIVTSIGLHGMRGRQLYVDANDRAPFTEDRVSRSADEYLVDRTLSRTEALDSAEDLAVEGAKAVFMRYGWDADTRQLRQHLDQLWERF